MQLFRRVYRLAQRKRISKGQGLRFLLLVLGGGVLPPYALALALIARGALSSRRPPRADAGIVLGCATRPDGRPSAALTRRALAGASLLKQGRVGQLILSGGVGSQRSEARAMYDVLTEAEADPSRLLLEERSHSTYQNLLYSRSILQGIGARSVVLITERYHLGRALLIARDLGLLAVGYGASSPRRSVRSWFWILLREASSVLWYLSR